MERMKPLSGLILKKTSPGWVSLFKDICFYGYFFFPELFLSKGSCMLNCNKIISFVSS